MAFVIIGTICFGLVVGWVTHRTIRRSRAGVGLSDLATILGAIGGGVITGLFGTPEAFSGYSIGLAFGFFIYLILANTVFKDLDWLGD